MLLESKQVFLKKKIFIIGGNARLAKALLKYYSHHECIVLEREVYQNWGETGKLNEILNYFKENISVNSLIFIVSGILNSNENKKTIDEVNFQLPCNIIEALNGLETHIITFGTILEKITETDNNYVQSKIKLSNRISALKDALPRVSHFRLHTLYGYDYPSEFMFLGQIFNAIKNKLEFKMTSGVQFREYHHFDDVVKAIDCLISWEIQGVSEITAGNGIQLKDLALNIFKGFELEHLIHIGAIDINHKEKFLNNYKRNPALKNIVFREQTEGVIEYLKPLLKEKH